MSNRLTAREIQEQEFPRKVRGFDPEEVRLYLRSVSEEVERLNLENGDLREQLGDLRRQLEDLRGRETILQQTLVTAERVSEDLRNKAREESELIVKQGRFQAERMMKEAQDRLAQLEADISRSRVEREGFEHRLRSVIEQHLTLLDMRREARGELDNLRVMPTRVSNEAG
jgi:cell division initiation protein